MKNMLDLDAFDVLILAGWQGSGPCHWQTHWQEAFPAMHRVEQDDWDNPVYAVWSARLSEVVAQCHRPVLLVAHSLTNQLVARWAQEADAQKIAGALLVAPTDIERFVGQPEFTVGGFDPIVLEPLPFKAFVLASRDDDRVDFQRARTFADAWGARFVDVGELGHIGSAAKLGLWPRGLVLLGQLIESLRQPSDAAMAGNVRLPSP